MPGSSFSLSLSLSLSIFIRLSPLSHHSLSPEHPSHRSLIFIKHTVLHPKLSFDFTLKLCVNFATLDYNFSHHLLFNCFQTCLVLAVLTRSTIHLAHCAALNVRKADGEEATFLAPETNSTGNYNTFLNLKVGGDLNVALEDGLGIESLLGVGMTTEASGQESEATTTEKPPMTTSKKPPAKDWGVVGLALLGGNTVDALPVDKKALPLPNVAGPKKPITFKFGSAGGAVQGETIPLSCGGDIGKNTYTDKCLTYDPKSKIWSESGQMSEKRCFAKASTHPDLGLVITGGTPSWPRPFAAVETTRDGKHFSKPFPDMPLATRQHCQVTVDANTIMVFGGTTLKDFWARDTQQLDISKKMWKLLPKMPTGRTDFGCGVVNVAGTPKGVIVAGGHTPAGTDKVEVLDLLSLTWKSSITTLSTI